MRPARPARCSAAARLMGSRRSASSDRRASTRCTRARPLSTTPRTPGTVIEVCATFVATTTRGLSDGCSARSCSPGGIDPCRRRSSSCRAPGCARNATSVRSISPTPGMNTSTSPATSSARRTARAAASSHRSSPRCGGACCTDTGCVRPCTCRRSAPSASANRSASSVALITTSFRSARAESCRRRTAATARSACRLRSWNSSTTTAATPGSVGCSSSMRRNTPSVRKPMRTASLHAASKRVRQPTASPGRVPISSATRRATSRAASRRGSSTSTCPFNPASSNSCGTCVVLPEPVSAVSTTRLPRASAAASSAARPRTGRLDRGAPLTA